MDTVTIRNGTAKDFDAADSVVQAATAARRGGVDSPPAHRARLRHVMRKSDAFLIVADDDGAIVGMASAMQGLTDDGAGPPSPGLCFLSSVYVAPHQWSQGIGRRLVDTIVIEAWSRGYNRVQLWTHADNKRAQRLYEGRGFHRSGREKDDDRGERILHYELSLGGEEDRSLARMP